MPVSFTCTCSKERFGDAIIGLGQKEIQDMIERMVKQRLIVISVIEKYHYSKEELEVYLKGDQSNLIKVIAKKVGFFIYIND